MKKVFSVMIKVLYGITLINILVFLTTSTPLPYGLYTLFLGGVFGLIYEFKNNRKKVMIILHLLALFISIYIFWIIITFDPVATIVYF